MTSGGEFVKGKFGSRFKFSLSTINNDLVLPPGDYVIMVDPLWNEAAQGKFKEVMLDIYSKE